MPRLAEKIAIVVGAGQTPGATIGNGRATAIRFAEEGATVLLVDQKIESAEETLAMVQERGGNGSCLKSDVTDETQCEAIAKECVERYGRIDVLHNNVGIALNDSGPTKVTETVWDGIFDANIKSIMFICKHVLPVMRKQNSGTIINISSIAAICEMGLVSYKASKAALNAYTHTLATGGAKFGIRANVIMPGLMNTPMAIEGYVEAGYDRETLIKKRNASVPLLGEMGSAWDVANAALFLASDEAKFITGACLPVDGGQSALIG
ncbi:MAG TPA: 3-oxoacyl-ACP reductase [Gammaproteobacteria bacterium]|nr:3-oxoacyl-ACP reductase [Gammaproteobacteria bacterium]|tara:strand:+ start:23 stop:817 length:795 start_codon:yes stop_codon:yes gene_type:complete